MRYIFRNRWAALLWAGGICFSAAHFATSDEAKVGVDAANSAEGNGAEIGALAAELN